MKVCRYFLVVFWGRQPVLRIDWTLQNEQGEAEEQEWEEDWDDEAADDDFIIQLRTELRNQGVLKEAS